jgi:branched-chain amino acid transport system permease protein
MSLSVARRNLATPLLLALLLAAFAALAWAAGSRPFNQTVIDIFLKVIFAVGLWVFIGNSGVISFGHIAFACLGGYVAAWTTIKPMLKGTSMPGLPDWLMQTEIPYWAAAAVGAAWAALWALIFGAVLMRLSGIAASIATLPCWPW